VDLDLRVARVLRLLRVGSDGHEHHSERECERGSLHLAVPSKNQKHPETAMTISNAPVRLVTALSLPYLVFKTGQISEISLLGALRPDLEPVIPELVLPVLAVEPPCEVLVIDDDRFLARAGRDADLHRLLRQLVG